MQLLKLALVLCGLGLLSGCAQSTIVATAEPACAALAHVCISREDKLTEGTAVMIEGNNLGRAALCKPPKGVDPCAGVRSAPAKPAAKDPKTS